MTSTSDALTTSMGLVALPPMRDASTRTTSSRSLTVDRSASRLRFRADGFFLPNANEFSAPSV